MTAMLRMLTAVLLWCAASPVLAAPVLPAPVLAAAPERDPDVVLAGTITAADRATSRDLAFAVPAGTAQVRVAFDYDGRDRGVTVTLGLADPQRDRGWGGGTKRRFAVAEGYASPGFLAGPIPAGGWHLVMTVPSIRAGDRAAWSARIWFAKADALDEVAFADAPLRGEAGWYRGDLHTHSGHSDARCRSLGGREASCPAEFTIAAGAANALDFLSLTDHNVTSHFAALAALQPYYDTLLLLPGRELTTRDGHANLIGPMGPIETTIGRPGAETVAALLRTAHRTGGFLTINHPARPTGEDCLGCGWAPPATDYTQVDAVEIVNGGSTLETPGNRETAIQRQVDWWQALLNRGYRLVGIAGSDNHDPIQDKGSSPIGRQAPVGSVATVVRAANLSQGAILAGLRSGRAFVDLGVGRGRILDLRVTAGTRSVTMGDTLAVPAGGRLTGTVHVEGVAGGRVELVVDGRIVPLADGAVTGAAGDIRFRLARPRRWLRADVRTADGKLWLIGNPIWLR